MKKLSAIFVALLLVAVSAVSAFAAGINDNEQKVLDELKTSVKMQGTEMYLPEAYVNQAENFFNTLKIRLIRFSPLSRAARPSLRLQAQRILLIAQLLRRRSS